MTQQDELLFKQLNELLSESVPNLQKISDVKEQLIERGYTLPQINSNYNVVTGQQISIDRDCESDHDEPFEDEGAPDDDFID